MAQLFLRHFEQWKRDHASQSPGLRSYLGATVNCDQAYSVAKLIVVDTVEHDDRVFRADSFSASVYADFRASGTGAAAAQAVMNHIHLYDVFAPTYTDADLPTLEELGRLIQSAWRDLLSSRYPTREFTVSFATEPDEYGPTVCFFEE